MRIVARELLYAVKTLFTTTRDRFILLGLVLIAAMISVSELAVAKLFTSIIDFEKSMSKTNLIILIIGFFLFFGITKAGHFLQRVYKVRFFETPRLELVNRRLIPNGFLSLQVDELQLLAVEKHQLRPYQEGRQ